MSSKLIPRAPSTSSEGVWTLQTHPEHLRNEGTTGARGNICCDWSVVQKREATPKRLYRCVRLRLYQLCSALGG